MILRVDVTMYFGGKRVPLHLRWCLRIKLGLFLAAVAAVAPAGAVGLMMTGPTIRSRHHQRHIVLANYCVCCCHDDVVGDEELSIGVNEQFDEHRLWRDQFVLPIGYLWLMAVVMAEFPYLGLDYSWAQMQIAQRRRRRG